MRDRLSSALKTFLLGSCIALAALMVTACGGAEESGAPATATEEAGAPAVAAEEPSAPAVTEAPADAPSMDASEPQADAPPSQEAGIAEEEAVETPAPSEEPAVEPRVTALHDGVPVDGKTVGFEEATVEVIDFSDFQ
ncbi:MAG: hypothetical protein OXG19_09020 [Chloroflexi bacterium]|nr:hypothetical protein [Chloroflexota bacterium]